MLSTPEVARRAGISYRQLDWWTRAGYARPAVDARGSGTQRLWTEEEARVVADTAVLRKAGLALPTARALAELAPSGEVDVLAIARICGAKLLSAVA